MAERQPSSAIGQRVAQGTVASGELVIELAREGDADALALLDDLAQHLGAGMAALVNLLNPECFVIGGGLGVAAAPWILDAAERVARARSLPPGNDMFELRVAELGAQAGSVGAAVLALDAHEVRAGVS
jgi:glucokinase